MLVGFAGRSRAEAQGSFRVLFYVYLRWRCRYVWLSERFPIQFFKFLSELLLGPMQVAFYLRRAESGGDRGLFGGESFYFFEYENTLLLGTQFAGYGFKDLLQFLCHVLVFSRFRAIPG